MAKTEKELNELREKVEEVGAELKELSEEELEQVSGGFLNGHHMRAVNPILGNNPYGALNKDIISAGH